MSANDFLHNITAPEIAQASDDWDLHEDAVQCKTLEGPDYLAHITTRLSRDYSGLHQRIEELVEGQETMSGEELFVLGVFAGATMLAHDITVAAEAYDAQQTIGDSTEQKTVTATEKLVRDKIPELIKAKGETAKTRTLSRHEYLEALDAKLREELEEYLVDNDLSELVDVLEVIRAIAAARDSSPEHLEALRQAKFEERGGFDSKTALEL